MSVIQQLLMGIYGSASGGGASGLERSVRLRGAASPYFERTPAVAGNRQKWTWAGWLKKTGDAAQNTIFQAGGATYQFMRFESGGLLRVGDNGGSLSIIPTQRFRDCTGWFHFQLAVDTTQAVAADSWKLWVNGGRVTAFDAVGYWNSSQNTEFCNTVAQNIGCYSGHTQNFDGYLADVYFIDGQQLDPANFTQSDTNGILVPKAYTGTYGTTGYHLDFRDQAVTAGSNVGFGKDTSGNVNYFNTTNISATAGVTFDGMYDYPQNAASGTQPVGNYAMLNPVVASAANISYGALRSGTTAVQGTVDAALVSAGSYWEVTAGAFAVTAGLISGGGTTNTTSVTANKVYGFRLTAAGALDYINITDAGAWTAITTGLAGQQFPYGITQAADWNFGQRPFIGTASGKGICTANLPAPSILKPSSYFNPVLYTGTGASNPVTGVGFQPDMVWPRNRTTTGIAAIFDSVRGATKYVKTSAAGDETTDAQSLKTFDADGFTMGTTATVNGNTNSFVAQCWKSGALPGIAIVAGISHVNGVSESVAHGLGAAPRFILLKSSATAATAGRIYHGDLGVNYYSDPSTNTGFTNSASYWGTMGSANFGMPSSLPTGTYVAYVFIDVPGFSKAYSFTGNGSADGPFVYLGFRPAFNLFVGNNATSAPWYYVDSARAPYNVQNKYMRTDSDGSEPAAYTWHDRLANGIKFRQTEAGANGNGILTLGIAFADQPFALNSRAA